MLNQLRRGHRAWPMFELKSGAAMAAPAAPMPPPLSGWVTGCSHPDMIKLPVVITMLFYCWSYLITVCSLLVANVVHVHLFPGQSPINLCTSAIVLSFIPLEDAWIFAFSASPLLSETEVRLTSPSHLKWKSKLGTSHVISETNVKLQQGIWIINYGISLSVSIASWCLELNCWADELGPLSQEDEIWRLSYISVWTLTTNWVDQNHPREWFYYCNL